MIIGIDGNEANIKTRVGVNVYAFELLWGLYRLASKTDKPITYRIYLREKPIDDMPPENEFWEYRILSGGKVWIISKLMPDLYTFRPKPDIFFTPSHYVPPLSPVPRVCSIMDLGYLKFSGQFKTYDFWQLKLWSAYSLFVSNYIIAISQTTQKDIVRHYPFASKKITVTHLAYDKDKFNTKISESDVRRIKKKYSIVQNYILYLGTLKPSKNIEGLIDAWGQVYQQFPDTQLVIAGKKGWLYESIFKKVESLGVGGQVVFTDFIDESDKPALIKGAKVFVLPSYWEGFGLDVLNAMAAGVPVIATNQGSVPEVVSEAAIIIDPYKAQTIAEAIKKVLTMPKIAYNKLVKKGIHQADKYSWDKTASETLEVLMKGASK